MVPLEGKQRTNRFRMEWFWAYIFIAPMVLGVLVFSIGPILYSLAMSFTEWNGMQKPVFNGIYNYRQLVQNDKIVAEIKNTFKFAFTVVPVTMLLSLFISNMLNKNIAGKSAFRVIYYIPNIAMPVAVACVWKLLYNSRYGLINQFLGLFGLPQVQWVTNPSIILWSIIIVAIWSNLGYNIIILLAALQNVPVVLYEVAKLDGIKSHTVFWRITFPMISPVIFFLVATATMNAMRVFDLILAFTVTGAEMGVRGPLLDGFRTMVFGIYEKAFTALNMGLASAEAVLLFAIIISVTLVQFVMQKKWVHY